MYSTKTRLESRIDNYEKLNPRVLSNLSLNVMDKSIKRDNYSFIGNGYQKIKAEPKSRCNMSQMDLKKTLYSSRDSIVFKEDTESILSHLKDTLYSSRDLIVFKEETEGIPSQIINDVKPDIRVLCDTEVITKQFEGSVGHLENTHIEIKDEVANEDNTFEKDIIYRHHSFHKSIVFQEDLEDLYADHTLKEEITIGPEIMQNEADLLARDMLLNDKKITKSLRSNDNKNNEKQACSCGKIFTRKYWFDKHKQSCTKVFLCDHCGNEFKTKAKIKRHLKIHNKLTKPKKVTKTLSLSIANERSLKRKAPYNQSCTMCTKKFRLKASLEKHMESHNHPHIQELHECHICDKKFTIKYNLKIHMDIFHAQTPTAFECDICVKTFRARKYLRDHYVRIHSDSNVRNSNWRSCKYCNIKMFDASNLNRHMKYYCKKSPMCQSQPRSVSHDTRIMTCDICQKTYSRKQSLKYHIMLHMGRRHRKVNCDICEKRYARKATLLRHLKEVHSNVPHTEKYYCNQCNKGFSRSSSLSGHKCFMCDICQRICRRKQVLVNHIMLHMGMNPKKK